MKNNKALVLTSIMVMFMVFACVPAKEFTALQEKATKCEEEREMLATQNEAFEVKNKELDAKYKVAKSEIERLVTDSTSRSLDIIRLRDENQRLSARSLVR